MSLVTKIEIADSPAKLSKHASEEFSLHEYLSDQADWNASFWIFEVDRLDNYCQNLLNLFNSTTDGFSFQALWAGEYPKSQQTVSISELIALLKNNRLGTSTRYLVKARMSMENYEEIEPKTLPRWVTIPLGMVLAPFTLICVIGSSALLLAPNVPPSFLTVSLGTLFLAGSLWVFYLSLRLLFVSPKGQASFITPIGLRAIALVFALIPIVSLLLGTFWEKPLIHSFMTTVYIGLVLRLWGIAKHRAQNA
ncbi:MAG: hypothetical protein Q8L60_15200 [Gammaproteobacteria bacterium]|nr:hypothetical protein [Gammaproteobacteria bacterium]MDP2141020.1 hypothetical protein [Gammaproteobacteria bacterium]MDP2348479.1 hypothetical protein [Gammaproteobacteria bacterium]